MTSYIIIFHSLYESSRDERTLEGKNKGTRGILISTGNG